MNLHDIRVDAPRYVLAGWPAQATRHTAGVLVIGGGAAGLAAALRAAEQTDVIVLTRGALPESNSAWAQGGIAAALDAADSPAAHVSDTLIAGAGLSDAEAVATLADAAPALMRDLAELGVPFERAGDGFALGLEGGHSQRRILHTGDATGWAITSTLIEQARANRRIRILEHMQAVDLLGAPGCCDGALALDHDGNWHSLEAGATILATGGAGALYGLTSNQPIALGEGIAMAYRAGAEVSDMEFVQFHPTVFRISAHEGFLITEAARGEGGLLRTPDGRRFMPDFDPRAELAPRDVVARGIFAAMQRSNSDYVLLDLTHLPADFLEQRFPTIVARCRAEGLDPARTPIPVAPAAHYLMGGIRTDADGATSLAGLFAAGECACTGIHGANRLASNSLLECLVFGRRAGAVAAAVGSQRSPSGFGTVLAGDTASVPVAAPPAGATPWRLALAQVMRDRVGLQRSAAKLEAALAFLATFPGRLADPSPDAISAANAALVARLIATAALLREESRGAHFRTDFSETDDSWRVHLVQARGQAPHAVERVAEALAHAA
ncbi:MAG: L-aspartate oxidase [Roseiflexaceae bacterium]